LLQSRAAGQEPAVGVGVGPDRADDIDRARITAIMETSTAPPSR
jgi:hypothetical protein